MSPTKFAFILVLAVVLLVAEFFWAPLLQCAEALARRYTRRPYEEMPDLREDDTSPQFTGKVV